jgi:hypothetical protein
MCDDPLLTLLTQAQSKSGLDLQNLIRNLSDIKRQQHPKSRGVLTEPEKIYLYLSLSGYSKGTIAYRISKHRFPNESELQEWVEIEKSIKNLNAEMANSIHKYIKKILDLSSPNAKIPSWKTVIDRLKARNYGLDSENTIDSSSTKLKKPTKIKLIVEDIEGDLTLDRLNEILNQFGIDATISQVIDS